MLIHHLWLSLVKVRISYLWGGGKYSKVVLVCSKMISKNVKDYFIEIMLAKALIELHNIQEANKILKQMLSDYPGDDDVIHLLSQTE